MPLTPGDVVCAPQRERRPERMRYDIVYTIRGSDALLIPIFTITGRPAPGELPENHAAHRAEILIVGADKAALNLPVARAVIRVDKMRLLPIASLGEPVRKAPAELMARIRQAVAREIASIKSEMRAVPGVVGIHNKIAQLGQAERMHCLLSGTFTIRAA
jgi:hypothetical protein